MVNDAGVEISFRLEPQEQRLIRRQYDVATGAVRYLNAVLLAFAGLQAIFAGVAAGRHDYGVSFALSVVLAVAAAAAAVRRMLERRESARDVRLTCGDAGLSTLADGRISTTPWSAITAYDVDDAIVLARGAGDIELSVPKRALPDGGDTLWSYLTARLEPRRVHGRAGRSQPA